MKQMKSQRFRQCVALSELAAEQGVAPVADLREIDELWPVDDDPDELLDFILNERRARRKKRPKRK